MRKFTSDLYPLFVNYTDEMYFGNEPCGKGHEHVNGGFCDRWSCKYGCGESYNGELIDADFIINSKIKIFICGTTLKITDIRYAGKTDVWEWTNNPSLYGVCISPSCVHELEHEKIESILNMKFNCKFWDMVQKRAKEIYIGETS